MLNQVQLIGHLGNDPEVASMRNGGEVANLSVATSDRWKDKDGNPQERTDWHRVVIFDPHLVEVAKKYTRKGSRIYLEGQLQTRKWQDQSGNDRYSTEVVLQRFRGRLTLLDRAEKGSPEARGRDYDNDDRGPEPGAGQSQRRQPAAFDTDLDDDLPF